MPKFSRYLPALILSVGLLPSAWLLYRFPDTPQLGMMGDDVMYVGAARSIADGQGYREAALPGNPWQTKFPPGYPVMLAAILKVNPAARNFWIIAHSWLWLAAASAALAWAMVQAGLTRVQAAVVAALWTANSAAAYVGTLAMTEALFCAVLFFAVGLVLRNNNDDSRIGTTAGALVGIAAVVRLTGVVAGCGIFLWLLWRRRFAAAGWFLACAALPPFLWMLWSRAHLSANHDPLASFYLDYGGTWLQTVRAAGLGAILVKNLTATVIGLGGTLLMPSNSLTLARLARDAILIVFAVVALAEWTGGAFLAVTIATAAFHLVWSWPPNERFLLAASPALLGALVVKLSSRPAIIRIVAVAVVAIADVYGTANLSDIYIAQRGVLAALAPAYRFIEAELPPDAIILGGEQTWLYTRRRAIEMQMPIEYFYLGRVESAIDGFYLHYAAMAHQAGAKYILVAPWDLEKSVPENGGRFFATIRADPGLEKVFSSNGVELFRVR